MTQMERTEAAIAAIDAATSADTFCAAHDLRQLCRDLARRLDAAAS